LGLRALARIAGLALLFVACLPLHLVARGLTGRSPWPRRFLAAAAWIIGARVQVEGAGLRPHTLLLPNHTSWLDILVLAGATGCRFVSKDDLGHGFVHWLSDQNRTIYVKRENRGATRDLAVAIAAALRHRQPVALFPEGTTGPGDRLLPFRSALLEAPAFTSAHDEVRPVAIDYGAAAREIAWYQESGRDNILRVLGRQGTLPVAVRLLDPLDPEAGRKVLASAAEAAIEQALGRASSPQRAGL
jgi:1-acyl-sn-glycerol-3-phosphate acyltransferase